MKDFTNADVGTFGENECLKYIKKVKKAVDILKMV